MSNLRTHSSLKEAGTHWIGQIPDRWETARLKQNVSDVNEQINYMEPSHIYVALENVESWTGQIKDLESEVQFESQLKRFKTGDVLFGKLRPYLAKVTVPDCDGFMCRGVPSSTRRCSAIKAQVLRTVVEIKECH